MQLHVDHISGGVGVDVMRLRDVAARADVGKFFHLMNRQFTPEEWSLIKERKLVRLNEECECEIYEKR